MKNTLLTFLSVTGLAGALCAQPTIPASKFFVPGTTFLYANADTTGITQGNSGANQTWNFASLTSNGSTYQNEFVTAASTPYAASFPGSNIAITDPAAGTNYTYVTTNAGSLTYNGFVLDFNGTPISYAYNDPQKFFNLPLTYNAISTDTYGGSSSVSQSGVTIQNYRNGTTSSLVDGYGTLITPAGTFTNVLRVRIREVYTDSMVYVGLPLPAEVTYVKSTSFIYIEGNGSIAVDRMNISYDTTTDASGTSYDKSVTFNTAVTTGIGGVLPAEALAVYPNPAATEIFINPSAQMNGSALVQVLDMSGRELMNTTMFLHSGVPVNVPVSELMRGSYILRIALDDKIYTGRFVRQ